MGQVYVIDQVEEKKYVGFTERGIVRVLEHLENHNPDSRGSTQCAFFIPERICKSGKRKGKKMYGRRCRYKSYSSSDLCKSHNKPKYRERHKIWIEKNEGSISSSYGMDTRFNGFRSSKWIQKYPPKNRRSALIEMIPNCSLEDENRITIEYMKEFGIENVRGGKWCNIVLRPEQIREIEYLMEDLELSVMQMV